MKNISDSELEVMQVLWKKGESTSLDIVKEVAKKKDWKNNTIMTLVSRLVSKGFIEVIRDRGDLLIYSALISETEYKTKETTNFIDKLYEGSLNNMLASFAKSKKLSKKDLEDLINLIDE